MFQFPNLNCHMRIQAKFNFTFTTPSDMVALFNTAEDATATVAEAKGMTSHRYDLSPPMSTYLVAFIVGRLSSVSLITQGQPRNISVWGTPDRCSPLSCVCACVLCACIELHCAGLGAYGCMGACVYVGLMVLLRSFYGPFPMVLGSKPQVFTQSQNFGRRVFSVGLPTF